MLLQYYILVGLLCSFHLLQSQNATEEYGTGKSTLLNFYQNSISTARGASCPMHPSCSQYAKVAFQTFGTFKALAFTTDRLMRCGHESETYEKVIIDNTFLNYDPVIDTVPGQHYYQTFHANTLKDTSLVAFLISKKQFSEARVELWKEVYTNKSSSDIASHFFLIGKTHFLDEDYEGLQEFYRQHFSNFMKSSFQDSIKFLVGKSHILTGEYEAAQITINSVSPLASQAPESIFLSGLIALHTNNYAECEKFMKSIPKDNRLASTAVVFENTMAESKKIKSKSAISSAVLSGLLPGSGYLVSGKAGTAFTSLLINSLFAAIGVEAFKKKNYSLGTGAILLGSSWYIGSIVGSYNSTIKWNQQQHKHFIKQKTLNLNLH